MVVFGGSSHPQLTEAVCNILGIPPARIDLGKFSVGETRVEVKESVRGKDVYLIQTSSGHVNDNFIELLIAISACKTASANKVTVVLPLFPYSRQSDLPYNKAGAPLVKGQTKSNAGEYTFESRPQTPGLGRQESSGINGSGADHLQKQLTRLQVQELPNGSTTHSQTEAIHNQTRPKRSDTHHSTKSDSSIKVNGILHEPDEATHAARTPPFEPQRGYEPWVVQCGTLVADLLTCAGADHVITMDLHDPQFQGFFDIPVDNLYGRHLLRKYIERQIPNYRDAVIVSPDAGGAKRATAIADALGMPFALIHKVRQPRRQPG